MGTFKVKGGNNLSGVIIPQGAKNEALQVISAVLLTEKIVTIDNIPNIIDVNRLIDLLDNLGVTVKKLNQNKYSFESKNIDLDYLNTIDFETKAKGLRGSIMIIGPLLSRFGKASIPKPGGDKIGRRKLDTHFEGLVKLGANFKYDNKNSRYNLISGGGRKNGYLINCIKENLSKELILEKIDNYGFDGDYIESQAFAYLAIRSYLNLPISFPNTTRCKKPTLGGEVNKNF